MGYMHKKTWFGSQTHQESLIYEGISAGRNWALIKYENHESMWYSYILRVDISEWRHAYDETIISSTSQIFNYIHFDPPINDMISRFTILNQSPGWWNNGFTSQLCFSCTLFTYYSKKEQLKQKLTGVDFDILDYNDIVEQICERTKPLFDFWKSKNFKPLVPYMDDF
jgi:hypothetical protein